MMIWFKRITTTTIFILLVAIGYYYDLSYQLQRFLLARVRTNQLEQHIAQLNDQQSQTATYQAQLSQAQAAFSQAVAIMPSAQTFNKSVDNILSLAQENHIKVMNVHPQPTIVRSFYHEVPIQMTLSGSYQQLLQFMQLTTQQNMLIHWGNWTLSRERAANTIVDNTTNDDQLVMNVIISFYYYP